MTALPEPVLELIAALNQLPGIGPRSAERLALFLVQAEAGSVRHLAQALLTAREKISLCSSCGGLTERQPCHLCSDPRRDDSLICVVERALDIISIEKSGTFRGRYHVLGGKISPLNGVGPDDLRIAPLLDRLAGAPVKEIILALSSDVEGDATSHYLAHELSAQGHRVTRIAQGLPAGAGLEFADELTLSRAFQGRNTLQS